MLQKPFFAFAITTTEPVAIGAIAIADQLVLTADRIINKLRERERGPLATVASVASVCPGV